MHYIPFTHCELAPVRVTMFFLTYTHVQIVLQFFGGTKHLLVVYVCGVIQICLFITNLSSSSSFRSIYSIILNLISISRPCPSSQSPVPIHRRAERANKFAPSSFTNLSLMIYISEKYPES